MIGQFARPTYTQHIFLGHAVGRSMSTEHTVVMRSCTGYVFMLTAAEFFYKSIFLEIWVLIICFRCYKILSQLIGTVGWFGSDG